MSNKVVKGYFEIDRKDCVLSSNGEDYMLSNNDDYKLNLGMYNILKACGTLLMDDVVIQSRYNLLQHSVKNQKENYMDVVQVKKDRVECWLSPIRKNIILRTIASAGLSEFVSLHIEEEIIGYCKECLKPLTKDMEMLPDYKGIYECRECKYPNAEGDWFDVNTDVNTIKVNENSIYKKVKR